MIANTFIKRPVTAIVISIVLIISGAICIFNLAVDQYPNISPPSVSITGSYTGADAATVEQTVAIPIEEQVNGSPGMEYMQSTNTNTGNMNVSVTFDIGDQCPYCRAQRPEPGGHRQPPAACRGQQAGTDRTRP